MEIFLFYSCRFSAALSHPASSHAKPLSLHHQLRLRSHDWLAGTGAPAFPTSTPAEPPGPGRTVTAIPFPFSQVPELHIISHAGPLPMPSPFHSQQANPSSHCGQSLRKTWSPVFRTLPGLPHSIWPSWAPHLCNLCSRHILATSCAPALACPSAGAAPSPARSTLSH